MMKVVLRVDFHCEKMKTKAMKAVSKLPGVESVSVDMKNKKLTVTGDVDPVSVVDKLKKVCNTEIISVGPAKEPEKKKDEPKKDDKAKKEEEEKKRLELEAQRLDELRRLSEFHHYHHYQMWRPCYCVSMVEEDPTSCVIC
ncbi:heavy metal-associated isoprenylated plant protein 12-like [Prosopis cineraria]|uniref:heavy metal-associated isoprenylated plant protein 12-like n=1 Tax=Prosopis cineraria TaxID=364024 RepID=UPI00240F1670|nr:heavy metal-associated isoprenylated plant protein 12-like [Prosopis cineraria]